MEKQIAVCIGTDRRGTVRARLSLMIVENGVVISERFHSVELAPGADFAAERASVEADITSESSAVPGAPWPAIPDAEWAKVTGVRDVIQTSAVVEAFQAAAMKGVKQ